MDIIRISTELKLTVHEFPIGTCEQQYEFMRRLIGKRCEIYERVTPRRLYMNLHMKSRPTNTPGECVSMLVDEEGRMKELEPNLVGSYLYETDIHGDPIVGNILFVGEQWDREGIDFCGIEDSVLESLKQQLDDLLSKIKK